jgi:hypothetical protein
MAAALVPTSFIPVRTEPDLIPWHALLWSVLWSSIRIWTFHCAKFSDQELVTLCA